MKFSSSLLLFVFGAMTLAKELAPNARTAQVYSSGSVHSRLVNMKLRTHEERRAAGEYESSQYAAVKQFTPCVAGQAGEFKCSGIDLYHFSSHAELGSTTGEGSSIWGWTSPDGREFAVVGQADGAAFVEVLKDGSLKYRGRLPQTTGAAPSIWREIRVYKHYAVIGSEAEKHNVQIFDLKKLLKIRDTPKTFDTVKDLTGLFTGLPIGRTHNIVINEEKEYAIAVGAAPRTSTCASGLIFIDLKDPSKPTTPGCAAQDGYVHDAQCLPYRGPDTRYKGKDLCYGFNEDTLTIYDVTNRRSTKIISRTSYEGASYTHQGWVTDKNWQTHLITDDELDEVDAVGPGKDGNPITYIWDISDLEKPKQTGYYKATYKGIDHNQYVLNKLLYQSNYGAGLRVLDVSNVANGTLEEVAYFDVYPEDDAQGGIVDFVGSWASYAYFKSGFIVVNTIERGLFSVKLQDDVAKRFK